MSPYSTDTKMTSAVAMGVAPLMFRASSLKGLYAGAIRSRPPLAPSSSSSAYPHGWETSDEYYRASARTSGGVSTSAEPTPVADPYPSGRYPDRLLGLSERGRLAAAEAAREDPASLAEAEAARLLAASERLTKDVHAGWGVASPAEARAAVPADLLAEAEAEAAAAAAELARPAGSFDAMSAAMAKSYLPDSFDAWRAQQRRREEEQHWARYRRYQASRFPA